MIELVPKDTVKGSQEGKNRRRLLGRFGLLAVIMVIFVTAIILCVLPILRAFDNYWPPIENPDQLVQDCQSLPPGWNWAPDKKDKLPPSILALQPREVDTESSGAVQIWISFGGGMTNGHDSWGYVVLTRRAQASALAQEGRLTPTNHPNIFKFEER